MTARTRPALGGRRSVLLVAGLRALITGVVPAAAQPPAWPRLLRRAQLEFLSRSTSLWIDAWTPSTAFTGA
jgi:hypothetical protein